MIILAIRTDKPQAELYIFKNEIKLNEIKWVAHRRLAETILEQIEKLLLLQGLTLEQVSGVICFKGPGSFTGLRIGASVANSLAYGYQIPLVARSGKAWLNEALNDLSAGKNDKIVTPEYGTPPKTTPPKR